MFFILADLCGAIGADSGSSARLVRQLEPSLAHARTPVGGGEGENAPKTSAPLRVPTQRKQRRAATIPLLKLFQLARKSSRVVLGTSQLPETLSP